MHFVTDFADEAVVLPCAVAVGIALAAAGWRRGAWAWFAAIGATLAAVIAGKLVVYACAPIPSLHLTSPSGHTAAFAVACGGVAALLGPRRWRTPLATAGVALAAAAVIGVTRVALGVHSRADVLAGAVIGTGGAALLAALAGPRPESVRRAGPIAAALVTLLAFHGAHLHAEGQIARLSHRIWPLSVCRPDHAAQEKTPSLTDGASQSAL
jgi:membrane-associated phospholipid phosphatase